VLVLLGISLGSLASRQLLQHVGAYPLTIALLALATFCATFGSSLYLQRVHGWGPDSASRTSPEPALGPPFVNPDVRTHCHPFADSGDCCRAHR